MQDVQTKVSDIVLGKEKPLEESDPDYEKLKHYIFELEDHLTEAQKQSFKLAKRHRGPFILRALRLSYVLSTLLASEGFDMLQSLVKHL